MLCRFEILAITETHLDKSAGDMAIDIEGMKLLRLDRIGCKGGGVMLCYAEYLKPTYGRDLSIRDWK